MTWLLESDPAVRWQVMRDLTDAGAAEIAAERARVAREGLGARILAAQGADGAWHRAGKPDWLPTLFTTILLRATGIDPADAAVAASLAKLEAGFRWDASFGAKPFFGGEVEPCINGGVLACGGYFGHADPALAERLLAEQLDVPRRRPRARPAHGGSDSDPRIAPPARRPLAPRPRLRRGDRLAGRNRGRAERLEHATSATRPPLVSRPT